MKFKGKFYQTEEEILTKAGVDTEYAAITGVEFNPETGEVTYTIRSSKSSLNVATTEGNPRKYALNEEK